MQPSFTGTSVTAPPLLFLSVNQQNTESLPGPDDLGADKPEKARLENHPAQHFSGRKEVSLLHGTRTVYSVKSEAAGGFIQQN